MPIEMIKSAFSRKLGRSIKVLLQFEHSGLSQTFRLVDNTEAVEYNGNTFNPYPFKFVANSQGETQGARLVLSNVDRTLANEIRNVTDNESIICSVWVAQIEKDGDTLNVDAHPAGVFEVQGIVVKKDATSMVLNLRVSLEFNLSTVRYNPNLFPNLYI